MSRLGADSSTKLEVQLKVIDAVGAETDGSLADLIGELSGDSPVAVALSWSRPQSDEAVRHGDLLEHPANAAAALDRGVTRMQRILHVPYAGHHTHIMHSPACTGC